MKILAINFRPDVTQIVEGKIQKGSLIVERIVDNADSVYKILENFQEELVEVFLTELLKQVKNKTAAAYFGISDYLVKKIDCVERDYVPPQDWDKVVSDWLPQVLQVEKDNFYLTAPIHLEKRNKSVITGVAVPSSYINVIFKAASAAGIKIKSIEPACYGLLRVLNKWDREYCVIEIWEKMTSITGYSPIRGMFKINESLGWSYYLNAEGGKDELLKRIVAHDYAAYNTYKLANTNIPIYLISGKFSKHLEAIIQNSNFAARLQQLSQIVPGFIKSKLPQEQLSHCAAAVGLALTPLHERMVENANSSG